MSLQKQLVHLNMSGGLQKKEDPLIAIPSKLAVADNVEFDDLSTVATRGGQSLVSLSSLLAAIPVRQGERLFTHKGIAHIESRGDAVGALGGGLHRVRSGGSTSPVGNPQTVTGFTSPFRFRRAGMVADRVMGVDRKGTAYGAGTPFYDGSYDFAIVDGYRYYAAETRDPASGKQTIKYAIYDDASGFKVVDGLLSDGTNVLTKPRIAYSTGKTTYLYFASFVSGGVSWSLKVVSLSSTGVGSVNNVQTTAATGGTIEGTAVDSAMFDAAYSADGAKLGVVIRDATAARTTILFRSLSTSDGFTVINTNSGTASAAITTLTCLFSNYGSGYKLHAFYGIGTAVAKAMNYDTSIGVSAESTVGTAPSGTVGRIVAYENSTTQIFLAFDATSSPGAMTVSTMRLSRFSHTYGALTECASSGPWLIAGRIASVQSRLYLPMFFLSANYQITHYLIDLTEALNNLGVAGNTGAPWQVLARIDYGEGALDSNRWNLSTRVPNTVVNSNTIDFAYLKTETDLRIAGSSNDTPIAVHRVSINLQSQLQHEEINGLTFLAGACPYIYDGSNMVEEGFHHGPEIDTTAALVNAGTGGYQLPNATTSYTVCFTVGWEDAQGNWHESAPSNQRTFSVTGGSGNYYIPIAAVVLPPSQKANYQVVMYRTPALGTNTALYLASKLDGTYITSDPELILSEQLYTAGGVLPNTPAPACRHVSVFQKRLVLSGCGDGSRIHWSKQTTPGYGVEFSSGDPTHQMQVPSDKGRVVGSKEMDDRLVVLCENGVGVIGGQGPAPTGTAGQYSDFSSVVTETGCSWDSPKSIARGPEGVWFRSPFGIRLIGRNLALALSPDGRQAGAEVDSLVSGTVIAVAGDAKQQIRFYQSSGTALVWDYQWRQWTRFTQMQNVDACYADDRYYTLTNYNTSTPLLRYTDVTASTDWVISGATIVQATVPGYTETQWLSLAGIQGFQRVYRLLMLFNGSASADINAQIALGFNFDPTSPPTAETAAVTVASSATGIEQLQHHLAKQKCESLKIGVLFYSTTNPRLRLVDLTLQVGVKGGFFKMPSSQRF